MAVKNLGKKGIFLTFISIAIVATVIIIFTPSDINLKNDISIVETRVSKVDTYVFDLENVYMKDTLKAIGRRTIIALINYMEAKTIAEGSPVYLIDFENDFIQVLLDGEIDDPDDGITPIDFYIDPDLMTGNTFNDFLIDIKNTAEQSLNVETKFNLIRPIDIRVFQITPFLINVEADILFSVQSIEGIVSWNRNVTIRTEIPIENLEDPYYLVNSIPTGVSYFNKINESKVNFNEWDIIKVKTFIRDGEYTHFEESQAPSYIGRFTNNLAKSDCCSIESYVNPNKLAVAERDKALSYLDYKFFPTWQSAPACAGVPDTLYIENSFGGVNVEFPNIKFEFNDLVTYKIIDDALAVIVEICP